MINQVSLDSFFNQEVYNINYPNLKGEDQKVKDVFKNVLDTLKNSVDIVDINRRRKVSAQKIINAVNKDETINMSVDELTSVISKMTDVQLFRKIMSAKELVSLYDQYFNIGILDQNNNLVMSIESLVNFNANINTEDKNNLNGQIFKDLETQLVDVGYSSDESRDIVLRNKQNINIYIRGFYPKFKDLFKEILIISYLEVISEATKESEKEIFWGKRNIESIQYLNNILRKKFKNEIKDYLDNVMDENAQKNNTEGMILLLPIYMRYINSLDEFNDNEYIIDLTKKIVSDQKQINDVRGILNVVDKYNSDYVNKFESKLFYTKQELFLKEIDEKNIDPISKEEIPYKIFSFNKKEVIFLSTRYVGDEGLKFEAYSNNWVSFCVNHETLFVMIREDFAKNIAKEDVSVCIMKILEVYRNSKHSTKEANSFKNDLINKEFHTLCLKSNLVEKDDVQRAKLKI